MEDDERANDSAKPAGPPRLAVFEGNGGDKALLAIIAANKAAEGKWTLQGSGQNEAALERVRMCLDVYSADQKNKGGGGSFDSGAPPNMNDVAAVLSRNGFAVEGLAVSDHQIDFQLDMNTGTTIGMHTAMHPFAATDNSTGRNIFEAIANVFSKASNDLAVEIHARLDEGDFNAALKAVEREADHGLFSLGTTPALLPALLRFDVTHFARDDRRLIRDVRIMTAHRLGRFEVASEDAEAMLQEDADRLNSRQVAQLNMVIALGAIRRGETETGLSILRNLLKEPTALDAEGRGWAWVNISLALHRDDPKARHAARMSADAFLEAGKKVEAGKSLMRLARLLMQDAPAEAVSRLNEMISLLDKESLLDRHARAAALHARANRLASLRRHDDAYRDAREAVELRRGLLGADEAFVSTLHLAALEARHVGDQAAADAFEEEAEALTAKLKLPHFQLAERVSTLMETFDPQDAEQLVKEAEAAQNLEIIVAVRVVQASRDTSLSDTARLRILEETHSRVMKARGPSGMLTPVYMAMGQQLARAGHYDRAESWFRKIIANDAHNAFASQGLVDCLWRQEKWGDAADFLRRQIASRGDLPGILYAFARSLFEAGDVTASLVAAAKVLESPGLNVTLRKHATELRDRALPLLGEAPLPGRSPALIVGSLTRAEFETALDDFGCFISAEKRMRFWVNDKKGKHEWISAPEGRAQDLLHGFLRARFGDRVEIFPELATGAGRIDLYMKFEGGVSIVIELKMSGGRYSTPYAASGEQQIHHYMDNRKTHLGYLVVFDARIERFEERLLTQGHATRTVVEKFIDVRPTVKMS